MLLFGIKLTFDIRKLKSEVLIIELLHSFFKFIEMLVETNLRRLEKIQLSKLMSTKCYRSQRFKLVYLHMVREHIQIVNQLEKLTSKCYFNLKKYLNSNLYL